jgi:hypothetical protein
VRHTGLFGRPAPCTTARRTAQFSRTGITLQQRRCNDDARPRKTQTTAIYRRSHNRVLDTNVLAAAARSSQGAVFALAQIIRR